MPQVTLLDIPAAAIGALLIAAAVRWAWATGSRRAWQWALVVGLAVLAFWRLTQLDDGLLTTLDVMLGFLAGMLLFNAVRSAWADGVFEKQARGHENTPMFVLLFAGFMSLVFLVYGFGCLGLFACEANGWRWLAWESPAEQITTLPSGGRHVDVLPPGNWE